MSFITKYQALAMLEDYRIVENQIYFDAIESKIKEDAVTIWRQTTLTKSFIYYDWVWDNFQLVKSVLKIYGFDMELSKQSHNVNGFWKETIIGIAITWY